MASRGTGCSAQVTIRLEVNGESTRSAALARLYWMFAIPFLSRQAQRHLSSRLMVARMRGTLSSRAKLTANYLTSSSPS